MKLAEALILRADCQKRIEQLKQRLIRSAKVQEGDSPPEDPSSLLAEIERTSEELLGLVGRINRTNCAAPLGTRALADALAEREILAQRRSIYADAAQAAVVQQDRYSKSEVRFRSTVNVAELQETADRLARRRRELDAQIQQANWQVDLVE